MATALAPVELTVVRDDGLVHFGDVLQLAHAAEAAVLAADANDVVRLAPSSSSPPHSNALAPSL